MVDRIVPKRLIEQKNGIVRRWPRRGHKLTSEQMSEICQLYLDGYSATVLADRFKVSPPAIYQLLRYRKISRRSASLASRKYHVNEHAFDVLTADACYWIGFIFADGHVSQRQWSPSLTLTLGKVDVDHLYKFQAFLQCTHPVLEVTHRKPFKGDITYRLCVTSIRLCQRLIDLGLRKHLEAFANVDLVKSRDFWRGVVDGDGCISAIKQVIRGRTYNRRYPIAFQLVGGLLLIGQFMSYMLTILPLSKTHIRPHMSIYCVQLSGLSAFVVISDLYRNITGTSLDRKQLLADNAFKAFPLY